MPKSRRAQAAIDGQLKAFIANDGAAAYSFAAPNVKRIFPTVDTFMNMVTNGYPPVRKPQTYSFGKVQETGPTSIIQQVLIVGPDGKDYEAVYTLEQQPDGTLPDHRLQPARIELAEHLNAQVTGISPLAQPSEISAARASNAPPSIALRMPCINYW